MRGPVSAPKVFPQLKWRLPESAALSALEGARNCAAAGGAALANWAGTSSAVTHHAFRLKAGNPKLPDGTPSGLGSYAVAAALKAYGADATRHQDDVVIAVDALKAGAALGCCVNYGYIDDHFPKFSGQLTFRGGHFVVLYGYREADDTVMVAEGLLDGRTKAWGTAPLGPQRAPFAAYRGAMGAFKVGTTPVGAGKGIFIVVQPRATVQPPPPPPPDPPPPSTLPTVDLAAFMANIRKVESNNHYALFQSNGAAGAYQFMPTRWRETAPKVLGTDPTKAVASKTTPLLEWRPRMLPAGPDEIGRIHQDKVAAWSMTKLHVALGDWRRVACAWANPTAARHQPGEKKADGTYYWTNGRISYVNAVCVPLGFEPVTRATVLPPLPGG